MLNERKGRHRPIDAVKLGPGTRKKREKIKKIHLIQNQLRGPQPAQRPTVAHAVTGTYPSSRTFL